MSQETRLTYRQLEGGAKERARNHYIEHWIHDNWYDYIYEETIEDGKALGFEISNIYFSGFCSQGDGASWDGSVDLHKFLENMPQHTSIGWDCWKWLIEDRVVSPFLKISAGSNHYSHSGTMKWHDMYDYTPDEDDVITVDCILKGTPIQTVYDLIAHDTECYAKTIDDLCNLALDDARKYADEIYERLHDGYQGECDDHNIADAYDANNIFFNEEGVSV